MVRRNPAGQYYGSEFINELLITFCTEHGIEFTRSRPYHKNDQAWIEQKNGSVVRRLVGYGRLEGVAAGEALSRLYSESRLFVNFFQPSFKLASKERIGAQLRTGAENADGCGCWSAEREKRSRGKVEIIGRASVLEMHLKSVSVSNTVLFSHA